MFSRAMKRTVQGNSSSRWCAFVLILVLAVTPFSAVSQPVQGGCQSTDDHVWHGVDSRDGDRLDQRGAGRDQSDQQSDRLYAQHSARCAGREGRVWGRRQNGDVQDWLTGDERRDRLGHRSCAELAAAAVTKAVAQDGRVR
jgi:hypothetical protein